MRDNVCKIGFEKFVFKRIINIRKEGSYFALLQRVSCLPPSGPCITVKEREGRERI